MQKFLRKVKYKLFGNPYYKMELYKGLYLPPFRENQGLSDNQEYLQSAVDQLEHLAKFGAFSKETSFLDFGCGQGRIVNGIQFKDLSLKQYWGIDTHELSINWCNKWLTKYKKPFSFKHLAAYNARYNKNAKTLATLPFEPEQFNMVFLNSVFSHMVTKDIEFYLDEFSRVMQSGGVLYVTGFVEENVPEMEENPEDYISENHGALFRVRYLKSFYLNMFTERGFTISDFVHQGITRTKQSVVIATKL